MKDDPENLDRLLHEQLRALPDPPPPRDLIPKVLQRIAAQQQPRWWNLPWLQWPRPLRVLSCLLWAALAGAVIFLRAGWSSLIHASDGRWQGALHFLQQALTVSQTLWNALERLIASLQFPWLTAAAIILVALYLGLLGLGAVCYRLVAARQIAVK
ncbi:MAG: hypothetical protein ABSF38_07095 [Verrucomicrobiota bacterium]|jgi:hypothetical protein